MLFLLLSCAEMNLDQNIKAGPAEGETVAHDPSQTEKLIEILQRPKRRETLFGESRDEVAVKQGKYTFINQNELEACLRSKACPDALVIDGPNVLPALHYAVSKQNQAALSSLLKYGAKLDHEKYNEYTLIQLAISKNDLTSLAIILNYLSEQNIVMKQRQMHIGKYRPIVSEAVKDFLNDTAENLIYFTINKKLKDIEESLLKVKVKILKLLIQYGTKANETRTSPLILMYAAREGRKEIVELLLRARAEMDRADNNGTTALMYAASNGHDEVVELLLRAGAKVNESNNHGYTALILAAGNGHDKVVELLLQAGAKVNESDNNGYTALLWAAANGHDNKVVELLLQAGAEVDKPIDEEKRARMFLSMSCPQLVEKSLWKSLWRKRAKAEVVEAPSKGDTALILAAKKGSNRVVRRLLEAGAGINAVGKDGWTALIWAAKKGHKEMVEILLQADADVEIANYKGETALIWSAADGHGEVVKLLLDAGAEVKKIDNEGTTALMTVAAKGYEEIARLLIYKGAEVNTRNKDGWTALSCSACNGHEEVVKILLQAGVEIDAKDKHGWTAVKYAAKAKQDKVLSLLLDAGAKKLDNSICNIS